MKNYLFFGFISVLTILFLTCAGQQYLPIDRYYDYDRTFPLDDSSHIKMDTEKYVMYYVTYRSFHDVIVTGLLTIPKNVPTPMPAIIFVHGIKDNKQTDYMEIGNQFMIEAGYAVLRIDVANHGDRKIHNYKYDLIDGYRYWFRDIITQTVFDLRRTVDYLKTRPEIDSKRIGYFGISFGGIIGTVFCAVDKRIKVPVIALAGGGFHWAFIFKALTKETAIYLSIIDPINFVEKISPRPLLMLNAKKDEVVPPFTTKAMYLKAGEPKKIVWYPTKHREVPLDQAFPEGIRWFNKYLK